MRNLLYIASIFALSITMGCSEQSGNQIVDKKLALADTISLLDVGIGMPANVIMSQFERMGYKVEISTVGFSVRTPFMWNQMPFSRASVFIDNDTVAAVCATYTMYSLRQGEHSYNQFKNWLYPDSVKSLTPPKTTYLEEIRYFNGRDSVNLFLDKTDEVDYIDERWNIHNKDAWDVSIVTKHPQK